MAFWRWKGCDRDFRGVGYGLVCGEPELFFELFPAWKTQKPEKVALRFDWKIIHSPTFIYLTLHNPIYRTKNRHHDCLFYTSTTSSCVAYSADFFDVNSALPVVQRWSFLIGWKLYLGTYPRFSESLFLAGGQNEGIDLEMVIKLQSFLDPT